MRKSKTTLVKVYGQLRRQHGDQYWWPAESAFEIMVGAILTQNTAWTNVEKAIANLRYRQWLSAEILASVEMDQLAQAIRPSGYFNIKARRLQAYCQWYLQTGASLFASDQPLKMKREALLAVHGIGPETADDILLYALELPVFVVDAYTRRIFSRLGMLHEKAHYEEIRDLFERQLPPDVRQWGEYHALIVQHGKDICRKKPNCTQCGLNAVCTFNQL